ncbi:BspA family leucine-rich repeat surface protein [uncultured Prevotella sp.]|uniref:BspA family leucine-rich repeat surface protein n=1 Tax=uncultured Prevotella sp. TaxID=159272 RepID=UPI002638E4A3|nr:BspA family leucine-rich repeat surface protein [uncultured Prevotella sp.]
MYAWVRPWAKYADGTLTFYYGEKSSLGTGEYELRDGSPTFLQGWYTDHKSDITKVVFDESFKDARPTTCYFWFSGMSNLEEIENLQNLNTSEVTYMSSMFSNCSKLQSLDLSSFNTANVIDMEGMFQGCSSLQSIKLSSFNTEKVWIMERMFYGCKNLQSLDLSNFNTANVKKMNSMFEDCFDLRYLDLSSFNTKNVTDMVMMFFNCNKLVEIYASNMFTTDNVGNYTSRKMFLYCDSLSGDIAYDQNHVDKTYAKIDGGYFRDKAYANRPWAKYADGTLTFFVSEYKKTIDGSNGEYELNIGSNNPGWITDHETDITKVVFDESFKIARPTTGSYWFSSCKNLVTIENISYLNTSEMTDMSYMFYGCENLQSLDVSNFNTENVTDMSVMFRKCKNLQSLDVSNFNTAKVKNMDNMFADCWRLQSLDLSNFNTENVTNMQFMFYWCNNLQSLNVSNFNTAKVENMKGMFYSCSKLQSLDVSSFNTENVTNMEDMFGQCRELQSLDLSSFNTANVENMSYMFEYCNKLNAIYASDKFTTSNVTSSNQMFYNCFSLSGDIAYDNKTYDKTYAKIVGGYFRDKAYANRPWAKYADGTLTFFVSEYKRTIDGSNGEYELNTGDNEPGWKDKRSSTTKVVFDESFKDARPTTGYMWFYDFGYLAEIENISYLNTSEMTDMSYMFYRCEKLQSLDLSNFNAAMVTDMRYMFYDCSNLQSINLSNFNAEKVTNMSNMFSDCPKLQSLDLSSFNTEMVETMRAMFSDCPKLQSLDLSNFNTEKVTDMSYMFNNCSKLQSIIISKDFTTKSMKFDTYMFVNCPARLYTPMADYMARSDNKKIYTKIIKPYFPINAKAEYGTLCSPVGGTLGEGTFYGFDKLYEVDADKTDDTKVVMKEVTEIEAGKPYVYRRNLTDKDPVANAIVFNIDETAASAPQNPGMLKGTFESMIAPGGSYILQTDGMFHRVSDSNATLKVGAYRAYLDLSSLGSEAKAISMSFEDSETTGIREVNTADSSDTPIYDLTGRRINKPQRGQIYIQNGKKRVANF